MYSVAAPKGEAVKPSLLDTAGAVMLFRLPIRAPQARTLPVGCLTTFIPHCEQRAFHTRARTAVRCHGHVRLIEQSRMYEPAAAAGAAPGVTVVNGQPAPGPELGTM